MVGTQIALATAKGNDIPNSQISEISQSELSQIPALEAEFGSRVKRRSDPVPRYNCHGMTFASRRTWISESSAVHMILEDDEYELVAPQDVLAADIILYVDDTGDIEHSGVVVTPPTSETLNVPMVFSKWGKAAEVIHPANACQYNFANARYYRIQK